MRHQDSFCSSFSDRSSRCANCFLIITQDGKVLTIVAQAKRLFGVARSVAAEGNRLIYESCTVVSVMRRAVGRCCRASCADADAVGVVGGSGEYGKVIACITSHSARWRTRE